MSATFDTWLNYFYTENWDAARGQFAGMDAHVSSARTEWNAGNDHNAIGQVIDALDHVVAGKNKLFDTYQYPFPRYRIIRLFQMLDDRLDALEAAPPVTVDMDAIINAMLVATFDELQKFIGIEDAYRVALWNAPFNAEFYAALARGFQKWP